MESHFPNGLAKIGVMWSTFWRHICGAVLTFMIAAYSWYGMFFAVVTASLSIFSVYARARDEDRSTKMFDLRRGSKAFLIGDPALVVAIGFLAATWSPKHIADTSFVLRHAAIGIIVGAASVVVFRMLDRSRYAKADALDIFHYSDSKLWHDFGTAFSLIAALVMYSSPLWHEWSWHGVAALIGVFVWVAGGIFDWFCPPNVRDQHALTKHELLEDVRPSRFAKRAERAVFYLHGLIY